ncbi:MAG: DUF4276 family protein [Chitinophagaceae bacterium]|nr:DUF4276 family protein [Chitinophagaceae bacterium]
MGEKYIGRAAKMRTVYIMVEGQTEEEFVNNSLADYLRGFGIVNTVPILLETSPGYFGGDVTFARYQTNANNLLVSDPTAIVTSLIDYYQLRTDFPGYAASAAIADKNARMDFLEQQISTVIPDNRFVPYIQLHEFEGLLFSDITGFQTYFPHLVGQAQFIINHNPNPELINDSPASAPSVRLRGLIGRRYKKTFHGPLIALENGITPVLAKCPRFKNWIDSIIAKATAP